MTRSGWRDGRLAVRLAVAGDLIGWAVVLNRPGDVFATSHNYDHLARWATQAQWVWLFALAGAACLWGLLAANRLLRVAGAAAACTMQAAIAVSFGGGLRLLGWDPGALPDDETGRRTMALVDQLQEELSRVRTMLDRYGVDIDQLRQARLTMLSQLGELRDAAIAARTMVHSLERQAGLAETPFDPLPAIGTVQEASLAG